MGKDIIKNHLQLNRRLIGHILPNAFRERTRIQRIDRETEQQIGVINGFTAQRLAGGR